jgi:hypothetical protein
MVERFLHDPEYFPGTNEKKQFIYFIRFFYKWSQNPSMSDRDVDRLGDCTAGGNGGSARSISFGDPLYWIINTIPISKLIMDKTTTATQNEP